MSEYSFNDYGAMIRDSVRMDAYARALQRAIGPDSLVLDIGAGNGILSLLAVQAGARHVFAVEPDDVIELARELAAANGCADRITFIQGLSSELELPEPADVIVSDLRGVLPLYKGHIPAIIEARERHLADGGVLIPLRDTLVAAPVELGEHYEETIASWERTPYGLDIAGGRAFAANQWGRAPVPAEALLGNSARLAVLEYPSISSPDITTSVQMAATRSGTVQGIAVWFDAELAEGAVFSNAPGEPKTIYGQAFFPILEPVELVSGDVVSVSLSARLTGGDYVFRWDTRVTGASAPKAAFTQSTVFSSPFSPETLRRHKEDHLATRTEDGEAALLVLQRLDGRTTQGDLSREVRQVFPALFSSDDAAFRFVSGIAEKYGR